MLPGAIFNYDNCFCWKDIQEFRKTTVSKKSIKKVTVAGCLYSDLSNFGINQRPITNAVD